MTTPSTLIVTGAAGFIGGRFAVEAKKRGYSVIAVDFASAFDQRVELSHVRFDQEIEPQALFEAWDGIKSSSLAVVHMGAITNTMEFDESKLRASNFDYTCKLWNLCTRDRVPLVYASSAATYGAGESGYSDTEDHTANLKPLNPYGWSKLHFDLWALEQELAGRTPPTWSGFKFFNVYGFGEAHKGRMASVVWHALKQIQDTQRMRLFRSHRPGIADGHQARDFVSVEDVLQVLWFALEKPIPRGIYNLGTGQARTFLDLGRAVFQALKKTEAIDWVDTPIEIREKYQYFTEAEMNRLREAGYTQPFASLETGISQAVQAWVSQKTV